MGNLCPSEVAHGDPQEPPAPTDPGGGKDPQIDGPIFVKDATPLKSQRNHVSEHRENSNVEQSDQQGIQAPTNPSVIDGPNGTPLKRQRDQASEHKEAKNIKHSEVISFSSIFFSYFT